MAKIKHEFKKIEMTAMVGEFKVDYTLTNWGDNKYGLNVASIEWDMPCWYPHEFSLDLQIYIGEVAIEEEDYPIFDFSEVNEKLNNFVRATIGDFVGEMTSMHRDLCDED